MSDSALQRWLSTHADEIEILENGKIKCKLTNTDFPARLDVLTVNTIYTYIHTYDMSYFHFVPTLPILYILCWYYIERHAQIIKYRHNHNIMCLRYIMYVCFCLYVYDMHVYVYMYIYVFSHIGKVRHIYVH